MQRQAESQTLFVFSSRPPFYRARVKKSCQWRNTQAAEQQVVRIWDANVLWKSGNPGCPQNVTISIAGVKNTTVLWDLSLGAALSSRRKGNPSATASSFSKQARMNFQVTV